MGSEQEWSLRDIAESPGGLVWVRRRNGSWWPGRIVRPEELPPKYLSKSGTPIKLLGREDGSMDWYNLEKSKRVKPFRCGEYDECIEKAKISALRPNKSVFSTGKYVRREDAILHALELEKAYFCMGKHGSLQMNNSFTTKGNSLVKQLKRKRGLESHEKQPVYRTRKHGILEENSMQESVVSFELPSKIVATDKQFMQKKRWKTPNDSEDDEGIKRMRGLQEIELGMVSSRKPKRYIHSKQYHELALPDTTTPAESNLDNGFSRIELKSSRNSSSVKKQSDHENVRRKDRRRPLTKVCEGSRVIIPSYCHWDGSFTAQSSRLGVAENYPGALISTSRRSGFSDTTNSSNTSETCSDKTLSYACENAEMSNNVGFDSEIKDSELSSMLDYVDNNCTNGLVNIPLVMGDNIDGDYLNINRYCASISLQPQAAKMHNICSDDALISCYPEGLGESSFTGSGSQDDHVRRKKEKLKLERHSNGKTSFSVDAPNSSRQSHQSFPHVRDSLPSCSKHKVSKQFETMELGFPLYDVELTVQTSYNGPHVPLVSLMSRLNGKAIVGHPVSVEVLDNGATDALVMNKDCRPAKNKIDQSMRNSANMIGRWIPRKEHVYREYNHANPATSLERKLSSNKNPRFSPRKIRKLSSISIDRKEKEERKPVVEKMVGPVVACVPLRLVFSRITEALSCSPRSGSIS